MQETSKSFKDRLMESMNGIQFTEQYCELMNELIQDHSCHKLLSQHNDAQNIIDNPHSSSEAKNNSFNAVEKIYGEIIALANCVSDHNFKPLFEILQNRVASNNALPEEKALHHTILNIKLLIPKIHQNQKSKEMNNEINSSNKGKKI